jgi:methanogenic corrinoid protein MtbC1
VIKRLMDLGHRPGKLVALGASELKKLADALPALKSDTPASSGTDGPDAEALQRLLECVIGHRPDDLRAQLVQAQHQRGLASLVTDLVAPLTEAVGNAWARGEITVGDEHLYAETVQLVLLPAVASLHPPPHRPRVLLTTAPQEGHGIGLLMAQTILALEGAYTLSLGLQTPLPDIVHMAEALQADIVALSFSIAANGRQAIATLQELRRSLPPQTDLWAGGACRDIHRRTPKGVAALRELEEIAPALTAWRQQHGL